VLMADVLQVIPEIPAAAYDEIVRNGRKLDYDIWNYGFFPSKECEDGKVAVAVEWLLSWKQVREQAEQRKREEQQFSEFTGKVAVAVEQSLSWEQAEQPKREERKFPEFTGKIVLYNVTKDGDYRAFRSRAVGSNVIPEIQNGHAIYIVDAAIIANAAGQSENSDDTTLSKRMGRFFPLPYKGGTG